MSEAGSTSDQSRSRPFDYLIAALSEELLESAAQIAASDEESWQRATAEPASELSDRGLELPDYVLPFFYERALQAPLESRDPFSLVRCFGLSYLHQGSGAGTAVVHRLEVCWSIRRSETPSATIGELRRRLREKGAAWQVDERFSDDDPIPRHGLGGDPSDKSHVPDAPDIDVAQMISEGPPANPFLLHRSIELGFVEKPEGFRSEVLMQGFLDHPRQSDESQREPTDAPLPPRPAGAETNLPAPPDYNGDG